MDRGPYNIKVVNKGWFPKGHVSWHKGKILVPLDIQADKRKKSLKKWRLENRDKDISKQKRFNDSPKGHYKVLKRRKNLNLTQEEFLEWYNIQKRECIYCEIPESALKDIPGFSRITGRNLFRLSIDRLNSKLPYQLGNLGLACFRCNAIKSDFFTPSEMKILAKAFVKPKWEK